MVSVGSQTEVLSYYYFRKFGREICEVEGCKEMVQSFCTAPGANGRYLCEVHHRMFHNPDGTVMELEKIELPTWK